MAIAIYERLYFHNAQEVPFAAPLGFEYSEVMSVSSKPLVERKRSGPLAIAANYGTGKT